MIQDDDETNTPRALTIFGSGTSVYFNAANTFGSAAGQKGLTLLTPMTLSLGNDAALGQGPFTFSAGASATIQSNSGNRVLANDFVATDTLQLSGSFGIALNGSYFISPGGSASTANVSVSASVPYAAINGKISGSARPFEKSGFGELALNGDNFYSA